MCLQTDFFFEIEKWFWDILSIPIHYLVINKPSIRPFI